MLELQRRQLAEDKTFDLIMLLLILVSALVLIVDVPRTPADSALGVLVARTNVGLTVAFTFELLVKVGSLSTSGFCWSLALSGSP